jgi:YVTN family beta-propeller protein
MLERYAPRACIASLIALSSVAAAAPYEVAGKWPLGGDGGWDYLYADSGEHLLYVSRADHVIVVDTANGKIVGDIGDTPGVHGIAIADDDLQRGFISAGKADEVKVFDLRTRKTFAHIAVGPNPDAILYEPATRQVLAFNGRGDSVSVIDAPQGKVVATVALGGKPEFARAGLGAKVFVNIEDKNELVAFDARTRSVSARWSLPQCEQPTGLALDAAHHRSFSVCSNAVMTILDTETGRLVAALPIGKGVDGADFDPATEDVFSANGEGTITVVHESDPEHFAVTQTLDTARGARTVALDRKTHRLYLPSAAFGEAPPPNSPDAHPRPPILPGTFFVLTVQPVKGTASR